MNINIVTLDLKEIWIMEKIIVKGGQQLNGTVTIEGAKNAVLPVIAASIIASEGKSVIHDDHIQSDVHFENHIITVDASKILSTDAPFEYVRKMRASVLVLGPLLARYGHAKVAMPGGCAIGSRPIELHLIGFEARGAQVHVGNG